MPGYLGSSPVFQQYMDWENAHFGGGGTQPSNQPTAPGAIPPLPSYGWTPGYGGIPSVPSPVTTAGTATAGNLENFGNLSQLAGLTNLFNQQQQQQQLIRGLPNYAAMTQTSSGNILSELQGRVPQDVLAQMEQTAAERGIGTGTAGSPSGNAALLRALGLTSLGLEQQGEQNLTGAIARTPQAPLFNPASFFVTPEQQQQAASAASLYGSAPIPSAAAQEAMSAARAGASRGGYPGRGLTMSGASAGGPAPSDYVRQPFASDRMGITVGGATGPSDLYNTYENAPAWQQWMGSLPGRSAMGGGGGGSTGIYGGDFMGQNIEQDSEAWNQLSSLGLDPTGLTRSDAAALLGVNPEELDLGAPATAVSGYGGNEEDFYGGDGGGGGGGE